MVSVVCIWKYLRTAQYWLNLQWGQFNNTFYKLRYYSIYAERKSNAALELSPKSNHEPPAPSLTPFQLSCPDWISGTLFMYKAINVRGVRLIVITVTLKNTTFWYGNSQMPSTIFFSKHFLSCLAVTLGLLLVQKICHSYQS